MTAGRAGRLWRDRAGAGAWGLVTASPSRCSSRCPTPVSRRQPKPLPPRAVSPGLPASGLRPCPAAWRPAGGAGEPALRSGRPGPQPAVGVDGRGERSTVGWELRSQVSCRRRPRWPAGGQREGSATPRPCGSLHSLGARLSSK